MPSDQNAVRVLVEIPKGSRNKYEIDPHTGRIELDRRLYASVSYPTEYGFVPDTRAADGDELDALVCTSEPTFPGCIVRTRVIGMLVMRMGEGEGPANPKLVCVPLDDPAWSDIEEADELRAETRAEIAHFFEVYKDLEDGGAEVDGWRGRAEAVAELERARERHASGEAPGADSRR